jgi:hypothetical protein
VPPVTLTPQAAARHHRSAQSAAREHSPAQDLADVEAYVAGQREAIRAIGAAAPYGSGIGGLAVFKDATRSDGRNLGTIAIARAVLAARAAKLPLHVAIRPALAAAHWTVALYADDAQDLCLRESYATAHQETGDAMLAGAYALPRTDVAALDRAIAETEEGLAALEAHLVALRQAREAAKRPKFGLHKPASSDGR